MSKRRMYKWLPCVYGLCGIDGIVRYVGFTCEPDRRLEEHLRIYGRNRKLNEWIQAMVDKGTSPTMRILQHVDAKNWVTAEREWIGNFPHGQLFNIRPGGHWIPAEVRAGKSAPERRLPRTPRQRESFARSPRSRF